MFKRLIYNDFCNYLREGRDDMAFEPDLDWEFGTLCDEHDCVTQFLDRGHRLTTEETLDSIAGRLSSLNTDTGRV